ncbi:MAG: efflux RND transporter permease subunit [Flavobacteriaceae bacterium]|nr:efflux RND transporter permease subunit [Flavobacteriaceae bacterium]
MKNGFAASISEFFLQSKLTILIMVSFVLLGIYSSFLIPREEEPQIEVPLADVFVQFPGATPAEMESRVVKPLEKIISNLPGVEYVYSTSMNEQAMVIVQFYVGENTEDSFVQLYNEIIKHMDQMPQGISMPIIKTRAIDDVPVLGLTLWSETYDDFQLKQLMSEINSEVEKADGVGITKIIGGRSRQVSVVLDKDKMAENKVDFINVAQKIQISNQQFTSGSIKNNDTEFVINTGNFLSSVEDVENLIIGIHKNTPVYLKQIATIKDGPENPTSYVSFGYGKANDESLKFPSEYQAVTLAVGKQKGGDAMKVSKVILDKMEHLKKDLIPNDVHVAVSRNYGETASDKVNDLLINLLLAVLSVSFVVMLAMGWRGGLVVFLSVPITFALTIFGYYFMDYTLNGITLFALVFVTGIVVDNSIIIAENMHRHFKMKRLPFKQATLYSINEVGNPTILATIIVIASVLPMAFVSGLMGPYMSPIPIGSSLAMLISLFAALTVTPYLGFLFLHEKDKKGAKEAKGVELHDTKIYRLYTRILNPLIDNKKKRYLFFGSNMVLFALTLSLFYTKSVGVKMLPFDNKNEFQIIVDMPEGTTLERTAMVTKEIAQLVGQNPMVKDYQSYAGTASPITFNGLVRHYDLRRGANVADIQVNLIHKSERSAQSHDITKAFRPQLQAIAKAYNANVKIIEVPPGPPVLSTLVAEVYGPDYNEQLNIASQLKEKIAQTADVADVDWMIEADQKEYNFEVDKEKAMLNGIAPQQIVATLNMALSNRPISKLSQEKANNEVGIVLQLAEQDKSSIQDLLQLKVISQMGQAVPISNLVKVSEKSIEKSIMRKNQQRVVYITADMAGALESPVYAILDLSDKLKEIKIPSGFTLNEEFTQQPAQSDNYTVKWDGEWQITYEVFRDLGSSFAIVIIIIYMILVGWFQSFRAPIVMMIAIPLSLVGIILGHWMLGAYFTATSMIGLIALAGIMVRNSVLLIDFANLRLEDGVPLRQAVAEAGAVRTTPILLTAGTVVIGAFVMLADPIFQGLAISLLGGTILSTVLTLLMVPLIYYFTEKHKHQN